MRGKPLSIEKAVCRTVDARKDYPSCPDCGNGHEFIKRIGHQREKQRFMCACGRTFYGPRSIVAPQFAVICRECGSRNARLVRRLKPPASGLECYCLDCGKRFQQGGRLDLRWNLIYLRRRIEQAYPGTPGSVLDEMLQIASLAVLNGEGYCWSVALPKQSAWESAWCKRHGREVGEYHPAYQIAAGKKEAERGQAG
jgi:hypothetical protein